jgi:hypothetical protein
MSESRATELERSANMTRRRNAIGDAADPPASDKLPRCLRCDGVISDLSDQAGAVGLDLRLELVSDECALICNDCTARLIEARAAQAGAPGKPR